MARLSPRLTRPGPLDTRTITIGVLVVAFALMLVSIYYLSQFLVQRQALATTATLIEQQQAQLLTATPAAEERDRLRGQLTEVQDRFAEASGLLPGTDVEVAVFERVSEAAERAGVELTALENVGSPQQEGSLVAYQYYVSAEGPLDRITNFTTRLEQEAFPAAHFTEDATLTATNDGNYSFAGTLTVYASTLSTGTLVEGSLPVGNTTDGQALREQADAALARDDYELAISLLLQLDALEPDAPDVMQRLYDAYIAYGNYLLTQGLPELAQEECATAQALNPSGSEAAACRLAAAQALTPTPDGTGGIAVVVTATSQGGGSPSSGAVTATTAVPPTVAEPPTSLPPTVPPPPTRTPPPPAPAPTQVQAPVATVPPPPTNTVQPTASATNSATPTVTGTPPTATPSITPTFNAGAGDGNPFGPLTAVYLPNCSLTQIKGTIRDARTGAPINGITVRVWWDGAPDDQVLSLPTGSDRTKGSGEWDVVLDPEPKAGQWYVQVVDRTTLQPLSTRLTHLTDTGPCRTGESGRQVVIQDFFRYDQSYGQIAPTSTPSPLPSATLPPSVTPLPSSTPTVTVTPSSTPYAYAKDEEPDLAIPDGPNGQVESTLNVPDNRNIRLMRVFLNINHQYAGDLEVRLVHPDGTSIQVVAQDELGTNTTIRRWFDITGADLDAIRNKSSQGTWRLVIYDRVEDKTGTLLSWAMEIYP